MIFLAMDIGIHRLIKLEMAQVIGDRCYVKDTQNRSLFWTILMGVSRFMAGGV